MARPRKAKEAAGAGPIIKKAMEGFQQMNAPRTVVDPVGSEGWFRVGQAKALFKAILDDCGISVNEEWYLPEPETSEEAEEAEG